MSARIIALHGFLGEPKDFYPLELDGLFAPPLFHGPIDSLNAWARRFNRNLPDKKILLGYSMGGRLALHCLLLQPQKYQAAIILAAHPGIANKNERMKRLLYDLHWAEKFNTLPFDDVQALWNSLNIFKNTQLMVRCEKKFSRRALANALRYFSLGVQEYLPPLINQLDVPILWLFPKDEKEKITGLSLRHPRSRVISVDGGHRFFFSHPHITKRLINNFLCTLPRQITDIIPENADNSTR